ncbi:GYD domain-containing protein [Nocardia lijiangensis]|uniref:GYD domain-containing protein n=1 Tax=Nocardia lijiangensis TaxID=299618 RepID=UPI00082B55B4|nr:GYD domain-containing protein [Nocardia lijiangensis]
MPKYLWRVSYSEEGARGVLAQGGSARRAAITEMVESVGGHVDACYFAFGEDDLFVIGDAPDEVSAAALAIRTAASGAAISHTVTLLTPEQVDEAVARDVTYRPPVEAS